MTKVTRPPLTVTRKKAPRTDWPLLGPDADITVDSREQGLAWLIFADGHVENDTLDYSALREAYAESIPAHDYDAMNKWTPWQELDKIHGAGAVVGLGGYHYCKPIKAWKACICDRAYNGIEFAGVTLEQAWDAFQRIAGQASANAKGVK